MLAQIRVGDRRFDDKIDRTAEQGLERFLQVEIGVQRLLRSAWLELDKEIEVASRGIEIAGGG